MSHLSKINTKITNTKTLLETLEELNIIHSISTNKNKPSIILHEKLLTSSQSHIEFIWIGSNYELVADSSTWQGKRFLEYWYDKIYQKYVYNTIIQESLKQGFDMNNISVHGQNNGSIRLTLEKWS
uniref:Uncharacterized protein ycf35 n=1 Tax=Trichogloeopsis pedicellata TaxID=1495610 RepID=A0A1G4P0H4_9FLOR|nr:Hypothetical protein ycf35 [Trichogloeopsis pedicellata]SCW24316.1 Hypothetical protein ycf35 [Trichogloeopsis pedicellata]